MASDSLRKKWGTIFMGGREATMEQLDAMQEPMLRERQQKVQQQDYLERVRKRAADRAREILGEAYAERQKVLAEATQEIEQRRAKLMQDIEGLKTNAVQLHQDAEAELERARAVGAEADQIKSQAYSEGYQAGMDQASVELKEFRADLGNELAHVMLAVEGQLERIAAFWRDDLAELTRVGVESATGLVLEKQHEAIVQNLVFQAINLLEQREVISFRVHPDDETLVHDLFRAAREKVPTLKEWIVNPDESVERGGLVAESGSGSVDLRRRNFQDLVTSILSHLVVPAREADQEAQEALHAEVARSAARFSASVGGQAEPEQAPLPEVGYAEGSQGAPNLEQGGYPEGPGYAEPKGGYPEGQGYGPQGEYAEGQGYGPQGGYAEGQGYGPQGEYAEGQGYGPQGGYAPEQAIPAPEGYAQGSGGYAEDQGYGPEGGDAPQQAAPPQDGYGQGSVLPERGGGPGPAGVSASAQRGAESAPNSGRRASTVSAEEQAFLRNPTAFAPETEGQGAEVPEGYELPDDVFSLDHEDPEAAAETVLEQARAEHPEAFVEDAPPPLPPRTSAGGAAEVARREAPASHKAVDLAALGGETAAPSLAELEEELFPVHHDEEHEVLTNGGFLPDSRTSSDRPA